MGKGPGGEVEDDAVGIGRTQAAPFVNGLVVAPHGLVRGDHFVPARLEQFPQPTLGGLNLRPDDLVREVAAVREAQHTHGRHAQPPPAELP